MECPPGLDPVEHLDAADLDQAIAVERAEARRLGVEHDFAHAISMDSSAPLDKR
jgi:hypothetical protein